MKTYDILDESAEELPLSPYARKKARHAGLWMLIASAAGLVIFGTFSIYILYVEGGDPDGTEEIALLLFALCMTFRYALLLTSAIQTRQGALPGRSRLFYRSVFTARMAWIFAGILALVFLLQVILFYATGFEMFGEITRELFHIYWY